MEWPCDEHGPLPDNEIESRLADLDGWSATGDAISKTFKNGDFVGSVRFVDSLVEPAEEMGHHPDLTLSWDDGRRCRSPTTPRVASPRPTSSWRTASTARQQLAARPAR